MKLISIKRKHNFIGLYSSTNGKRKFDGKEFKDI